MMLFVFSIQFFDNICEGKEDKVMEDAQEVKCCIVTDSIEVSKTASKTIKNTENADDPRHAIQNTRSTQNNNPQKTTTTRANRLGLCRLILSMLIVFVQC